LFRSIRGRSPRHPSDTPSQPARSFALPRTTANKGNTMKLALITGSLRTKSFSRAFGRALETLATELRAAGKSTITLETLSIGDLPHYDGDLDVDGGPEGVKDFKSAIGDADGLIIVTPEYNYSIPGVLKN